MKSSRFSRSNSFNCCQGVESSVYLTRMDGLKITICRVRNKAENVLSKSNFTGCTSKGSRGEPFLLYYSGSDFENTRIIFSELNPI